MWNRKALLTALALLISATSAQQIVPPLQRMSDRRGSFDRAIRLEKAQQFGEAIEIYKALLEANPKDTRAYLQLKSLYHRLGRFSELRELVSRRLSLFPHDLQSQIEFGEVHFLLEDTSKALDSWTQVLNQYPYSKTAYRLLLQMYVKHDLRDQLDSLVTDGRKQFNDAAFFSLDLGNIYSRQDDYEKAANEYITYAINKPKKLRTASSQLMRIADRPENRAMIEEKLQSRLEENEAVVRTLLSEFYFTIGEYKKAFDQHRTLGTSTPQDFERWLQFANNLRKENAFSLALESFGTILNAVPLQGDPSRVDLYRRLTGEALYGLALTYEKQIIPFRNPTLLAAYFPNNVFFQDHFYGVPSVETEALEETFALYDSILVNMPTSAFSPQAHFRLGEVKYRITRDFDGALESYQAARALSNTAELTRKSTVRIGDVLLAKGDLQAAGEFFDEQIKMAQSGEDEAIYLLKKCHATFLSGEMDSTLYLLGELIGLLDIADDYLNDVLELKGFVEENYVRASEEDKKAFRIYLQGEYLLRQHKLSEARPLFGEVIHQYPHSQIADDAALRWAMIQVLLGEYDTTISELLAYQHSPSGDRVTTLIGEIVEQYLGDPQQAIKWYLTVLEDYPESMLAEPVRHRIRELSNRVEMN